MAKAKINWYANKAKLAFEKPQRKLLLAYGFQVEGQAKVNVTDNGQVDTGFMRNSIYVSGEGESSYGQTDASGTFTSQKTGDTVKREIEPEMNVPRGSVYVVVGAEYAIHQETKKSFLYQALEQVAGSAVGVSIAQSER